MKPALCPTVATLRRYTHGDLDESEADSLDRHLAECDDCLAKLDKLSKVDTLFGELRDRSPAEETPHALHRAVSASVARRSADAIAGNPTVAGYTLQSEIGRGGMGQVYRATHPRLPVEVAIKLLRAGHDSQALRRRFESERETLARMDHPNIAKVFDAGIGADGRPFIAMEYVRGVTLGAYLATVPTDWRAKLGLFRQICSAIQHAHQKGAIHRDIKPTNVLLAELDGQIVPKVIDFGVACAADPSATGHTDEGYAVGTLEYMSPEQTEHNSSGIDTRTDVYSLGVLLYEMVAGRTPLAALGGSRKSPIETMSRIRDEEPPPPSRIAELDGASRRVRQELDWIVLKALEKDPARRYETVAAFSDDIRRLLADEPVDAAPPSRSYRLKKFVRRNRAAFVGGSLVFLALSAGIAGTTWQLFRARDAEARAYQSARDANEKRGMAEAAEATAKASERGAIEAAKTTKAYSEFLIERFLATARPRGVENGLGVDVTVAEALKESEAALRTTFVGQPKAEAEARLAIGVTWRNLGRPEPAVRNLRRAVELMQATEGAEAIRTLQARSEYAFSLFLAGRFPESRQPFESALAALERKLGADHELTLKVASNFAGTLTARKATATRGLELALETHDRAAKKWGEDAEFVQMSRSKVAAGYFMLGRYEEGLKFMKAEVDRLRASRPDDDSLRLRVEFQFAQALTRHNRETEGVAELERILPLMRKTLTANHIDTINATSVLAAGHAKAGRSREAIEAGEANVRLAKSSLGQDHPKTLHAIFVLGLSYAIADRAADCRRVSDELATILEAIPEPLPVAAVEASIDMAALAHLAKDHARVIRHGKRALEGFDDDGHPKTMQTLKILTSAYVTADRYAEAESVAGRYLAAIEQANPANDDEMATFRYILAECQLKGRRYEAAEANVVAATALYDAQEPNGIMGKVCRSVHGEILTALNRHAEAERKLATALNGFVELLRKSPTNQQAKGNYLSTLVRLEKNYAAWGKPDKAREIRAKLPREKAPPPRVRP